MLQMWTVRTHKDRMSNNIRRNKEAFKREEVSEAGPSLGLCQAAPGPNITYEHRRIPPGLFGKPTESVVLLYDKPVNTLRHRVNCSNHQRNILQPVLIRTTNAEHQHST
jgi:hypothetical protein